MKLCIALDLPTKAKNLNLAKNLIGFDIYLKIGLISFIRDGVDFVRELQDLGFKIFLDLKLYDIPNTMSGALNEIIKLNVDLLTIHASSGRVAMKKMAENKNKTLIFAVSALTSFNDEDFSEIYHCDISHSVRNLAILAESCGMDGMVCSPFELNLIKQNTNLLALSPGIRLDSAIANDDQKRVANLEFAKQNGADFIVIGRPIYLDSNPKARVREILEKMEQ